MQPRVHQHGFFLIEALVALLIFALGILGLVALASSAVSAQSDGQYRTDADNLAEAIAGEIALNVNRSPGVTEAQFESSLLAFQHQTGGASCAFSGDPMGAGSPTAAQTSVLNYVNQAANLVAGKPGLPGATSANQQIVINPAANGNTFNQVQITLCWKSPQDSAMRHHTFVTYVNLAG